MPDFSADPASAEARLDAKTEAVSGKSPSAPYRRHDFGLGVVQISAPPGRTRGRLLHSGSIPLGHEHGEPVFQLAPIGPEKCVRDWIFHLLLRQGVAARAENGSGKETLTVREMEGQSNKGSGVCRGGSEFFRTARSRRSRRNHESGE